MKNLSFDTIVGKHAKNQFKLWHFSREWRAGIIIVTLIKMATWIISIYAGFYFLYHESLPILVNKAATTITVIIALVLLELVTLIFLNKFFKFLYKGIIINSLIAGVIATGVYFMSFHMSTNGLAMRQANKVDQTEIIVDNSDIDIQMSNDKYHRRISDYHMEIASIRANPAGWRNGKPERLTAEQLKDIKEFNLKIDDLETSRKDDISTIKTNQKSMLLENKAETTAEADRYYKYVVAIMLAQFLCNGLLTFAWSRIYNENDKLASVNEDIALAENTIMGNFFQHIASRLFEEADRIKLSIDNQKAVPFEINSTTETVPVGFQNKTDSSNIGFKQQHQTQEKESSNTSSNSDKPSERKDIIQSNILGKLRTNDMLRYCLRRKNEGSSNMTETQIRNQCRVKRWKYFEFQNLMISAGLIHEPDKYKK